MGLLNLDYNGGICRIVWQVPWFFGVEVMAGYCHFDQQVFVLSLRTEHFRRWLQKEVAKDCPLWGAMT